MEITKLDSPDDDGSMARLARLCRRVDELLERLHDGESVSAADIEAVQREAMLIDFENDPALFRPFVAREPGQLN